MSPRIVMRRLALLAAALLLIAVLAPGARAEERILAFAAELTVRADGSLRVVERIEVQAEGREIRRGIFRDFPLRSLTMLGLNRRADFRIERIERDGVPEPFFVTELDAGIRIYIGQEDVLLAPGRHSFTIAYSTDPQLLASDQLDELYWNVTGDAWAFPIERAEAVVHLPAGAAAGAVAGYTGRPGEAGRDVQVLRDGAGAVRIATTRRLEPGEGFSVAVAWPAGHVARPSQMQAMQAALGDNAGPAIGLLLLALLTGYFALAWRRVGRDPEGGPIIPLFEPPDGLSPVATGFLWHGGFQDGFAAGTALATALTGLATKGAVTIEEEEKGRNGYAVTRTGANPPDLSQDEAAVLAALFPQGADGEAGADRIVFGRRYEPRLAAARSALTDCFDAAYRRRYRRTNMLYWLPGAAVALAVTLTVLAVDVQGLGASAVILFMLLFAAGFAAPAGFIAAHLLRHWRSKPRSGRSIGGSAFMLAIALAFLAPAGWVLLQLADMVSPVALAVAVLPLPVAAAFRHWLQAPTPLGRTVMDGIAGYRLYLSVAEAHPLNHAGRDVAITAALYEAHLPYAMALGVEQEWTERFEAEAARAEPEGRAAATAYRPRWYRHRDGGWHGPGALAGSLSRGLGGAAAKAVTRPSSGRTGSASSGGGSSGGGSGGGGGGGW